MCIRDSVGADLENLMNEAAIQAARDDRAYIMKEDIDKSFIKVGIGTEKKSRVAVSYTHLDVYKRQV